MVKFTRLLTLVVCLSFAFGLSAETVSNTLDNLKTENSNASATVTAEGAAVDFYSTILVSSMNPVTREDNTFTVTYEVKLKNTGSVDLTPETPNFSLTLLRKVNGNNEELITVPVNQTVKVGATSSIVVVSTILNAGTEIQKYEYFIRENLNNTKAIGRYVESKPYVPEMYLWQEDANIEIPSTETFDYGLVKEQNATRKFRIVNTGFAPLTITKVELPEGYVTSFQTPFVLDGQMGIVVPVALSNQKAGTFSGKIRVSGEKVESKEFNVTGIVIDKSVWFENFEAGLVPSDMILFKNWEVLPNPKDYMSATNNYVLENRSEDLAMAISPLMKVKKGETLRLKGAKGAFFTDPVLNIYYSADRINWTLAKEFKGTEFSDEQVNGYYSSFFYTELAVEGIPEGEWYIGFEGAHVRLDDLWGFEYVALEHDFFVNSVNIPTFARVNKTVKAEINIKNLFAIEPADSYTVKMYLDGEVVGEAECPEFNVGNKVFNVFFTPHKEGKLPAYFEIKAGNTVIKSDVTEVLVKSELTGKKNTISPIQSGTNYNCPITLGYEFSETQTVYTANKLGLQSGAKITGLSYDGFTTFEKQIVTNISIYLENTTDAAPDAAAPKDVNTMTLVYSGDMDFFTTGSKASPVDILGVQLATPFEYTGKNLRVVVVAKSESSMPFDFMVDKGVSGATIHRENAKNLDWGTWYGTSMPLINIYTEKAIPTLSGKVYNDITKAAVANANVTLVAGNVMYFGTTNAEGAYSIPVNQGTKSYQVSVEADGYQKYVAEELVNLTKGNQVLDLYVTPLGGVEGVEAADFAAFGGKGCIIVNAANAEQVNIYNIAGRLVRSMTVEEGTTTVDGLMAGFYIVNGTKVLVK